jgi:uncharacterized protein (DUF1684 family)
MKSNLLIFSLLLSCQLSFGQTAYKDSMQKYIANYVKNHEVVTGDDKKFLHFYPVNEKYVIKAKFEKVNDSKWFGMETSGSTQSFNRVYGTLHFSINDTAVTLNIYQSKDLMNVTQYKEYLFLPFTDLTSGTETYANGRYIDLTTKDIVNNMVTIDFNKAYNPYCAYVTGKYNCPIPPKENDLAVTVRAGEMAFGKKH